ncbi:MAG: putative motility protein [Magnetococcales bacterium]|nr:putative motility protein [Magnetococcales bacterium]
MDVLTTTTQASDRAYQLQMQGPESQVAASTERTEQAEENNQQTLEAPAPANPPGVGNNLDVSV